MTGVPPGVGRVRRSDLTRRLPSIVLAVGAVYICAIAAMQALGLGTAAAYLTYPAWIVAAVGTLLLALAKPDSFLAATAFTWTGHLLLLVGSAALNVAVAYLIARSISRKGPADPFGASSPRIE